MKKIIVYFIVIFMLLAPQGCSRELVSTLMQPVGCELRATSTQSAGMSEMCER